MEAPLGEVATTAAGGGKASGRTSRGEIKSARSSSDCIDTTGSSRPGSSASGPHPFERVGGSSSDHPPPSSRARRSINVPVSAAAPTAASQPTALATTATVHRPRVRAQRRHRMEVSTSGVRHEVGSGSTAAHRSAVACVDETEAGGGVGQNRQRTGSGSARSSTTNNTQGVRVTLRHVVEEGSPPINIDLDVYGTGSFMPVEVSIDKQTISWKGFRV